MGEKGIPGGGAPLTHATTEAILRLPHQPRQRERLEKPRGSSQGSSAHSAPPSQSGPSLAGGWGVGGALTSPIQALLVTSQRHRLLLQEGQSQPWAKGSWDNRGLEGWASV